MPSAHGNCVIRLCDDRSTLSLICLLHVETSLQLRFSFLAYAQKDRMPLTNIEGARG